ncbi:MAG: Hsp20/alpha crystallin family protein [Microcoleaceae cyanobacterium]
MIFTHQQPFHQLEQVERQVNQVFDELEQLGTSISPVSYLGNIQVYQTAAMIKLIAVLPNIDSEELKVEVIDKSVLISGKIDQTISAESSTQSQSLSPFRWLVAIPSAVVSKPVSLDYKNGILTLLLQKVTAI